MPDPTSASPTLQQQQQQRFRRDVLRWYQREARPWPWRATRDPYRVLASEFMLQQTQAARVEPAYRRFLGSFPTVEALAAATRGDVLRAWRGLGYNRRAVNLHQAARAIVARHGGVVPADLDALLALPGVGEYTARAVLAFAYEAPAAPVDTNIARVLHRGVAGKPLSPRALQALADDLVPPLQAHAWSQALMELGSRYCTARAPRCASCPAAAACVWRAASGNDPSARRSRSTGERFTGSDRFHRGRLVEALRAGSLPRAALTDAAQLDGESTRLETLVAGLVSDGLAEWHEGSLRLPE